MLSDWDDDDDEAWKGQFTPKWNGYANFTEFWIAMGGSKPQPRRHSAVTLRFEAVNDTAAVEMLLREVYR